MYRSLLLAVILTGCTEELAYQPYGTDLDVTVTGNLPDDVDLDAAIERLAGGGIAVFGEAGSSDVAILQVHDDALRSGPNGAACFTAVSATCTDCGVPDCSNSMVRTIQIGLEYDSGSTALHTTTPLGNVNFANSGPVVSGTADSTFTPGGTVLLDTVGTLGTCGSFSNYFDVALAAPATGPLTDLRINEWADAAVDYIELKNMGSLPVNITPDLKVQFNSTTVSVTDFITASDDTLNWQPITTTNVTIPADGFVLIVGQNATAANINTIRTVASSARSIVLRSSETTLLGSGDRLNLNRANLADGTGIGATTWSTTPDPTTMPTADGTTYAGLYSGATLATDTTVASFWYSGNATTLTRTPGAQNQAAPAPTGATLSGNLKFQAPPATCDLGNAGNGFAPVNCELGYTAIAERPIRFATVVLRDGGGNSIGTATTDASGNYTMTYTGAETTGELFVFANATIPGKLDIDVIDNTDGGSAWGGFVNSSVDLTQPTTVSNVTFEHGFNTTTGVYDNRASGPFSVADNILTIAKSYTDADASYDLVQLNVNWSPNNRPESGDLATGRIGTSFYSSGVGMVYVLGQADVDTDEFDAGVLLHEWTHYFEDKESRSDSIGGTHGSNDVLDPRVAWGEGMANAVASLLNPNGRLYVDTSGNEQASGFGFDMELQSATNPGWWDESSVQYLVYDLFDNNDDGADAVSLPMSEFWTRMVNDQRVTPAFTTVFSFLDAVKDSNPGIVSGIDLLTVAAGTTAVVDAFGTLELNEPNSGNLPVYEQLAFNVPVDQSFDGTDPNANRLRRNKYARFTGTGSSVTLTSTSLEDVDFQVFSFGLPAPLVANEANTCGSNPCVETATFNTVSGAEYVVAVQTFGSGAHTATLEITP